MIAVKKSEFDTAVCGITDIFPALSALSAEIKNTAVEIRLRVGQPILIRYMGGYHRIQNIVTVQDIENCVCAFCKGSVHSYEKEIANGFITLDGGHRAGLCGTAVYSDGAVSNIKNICSVNIRIARQHKGCADRLCELFFSDSPPSGLLIAGKPLTGKTTLLRDLIRQISSRFTVTVIDERYEIAAAADGIPGLDVGVMTDVLSGFYKNDGIERAVRTLSPQYVAMDELGFDADKIKMCLNCGAGVIVTAHCENSELALVQNDSIRGLLQSGAISHIALLSDKLIGRIDRIIPVTELLENEVL